MPKVIGTRRERALTLLRRLEEGPRFSRDLPEEAARQYRRWSASWILQDVIELVRELKNEDLKS